MAINDMSAQVKGVDRNSVTSRLPEPGNCASPDVSRRYRHIEDGTPFPSDSRRAQLVHWLARAIRAYLGQDANDPLLVVDFDGAEFELDLTTRIPAGERHEGVLTADWIGLATELRVLMSAVGTGNWSRFYLGLPSDGGVRTRFEYDGELAPSTPPAVDPYPRPQLAEPPVADLQRDAAEHAHRELGPHAHAWLSTVRPAVDLRPARPGEQIVARFGGKPRLPMDMSWPEMSGAGARGYIGEVNLEALAASGIPLDIPLAATGRLLFFAGGYNGFGNFDVYPADADDDAQRAVVLHVTNDDVLATEPAHGNWLHSELEVAAHTVLTHPGNDHPVFEKTFDTSGLSAFDHPASEYGYQLSDDRGDEYHQVGGWSVGIQGAVEPEAAHQELAGRAGVPEHEYRYGPDVDAETGKWTLLFQIDSYANVKWGDRGVLYFLARHDDLAAGDLTRVRFVLQSC